MRRLVTILLTGLVWLIHSPASATPWHDYASCDREVRAGHRQARSDRVIRVATWHLDGAPRAGRTGTHYRWLACTLAWMQADVVALQGLRSGYRARSAMAKLVQALNRRTGGRWRFKLDSCRGRKQTSVGLLWNAKRLRASRLGVVAALNPYRRSCRLGQRPGVRGYFKARGGVDFHLVSVDLPTSVPLLKKALSGLPSVYGTLVRQTTDGDVIVAGAFHARSGWVGRRAATLRPGFRLVPANRVCSRRGPRPGLVSQILASARFAEVPGRAVARVVGPCAHSCAAGAIHSAAALSGHCPIYVDLENRDRDPRREGLGGFIESKHGGRTVAGKLPRKLSPDMIRKVLRGMKRKLRRACRKAGAASLQLTILGATGKVMKVVGGKDSPACAVRVMKTAVFPRFQVQAIEVMLPVVW